MSCQNFIVNLGRDPQKKSHESVDEKSLYIFRYVTKNDKKKSGLKWVNNIIINVSLFCCDFTMNNRG